jgi:hypothetical protein
VGEAEGCTARCQAAGRCTCWQAMASGLAACAPQENLGRGPSPSQQPQAAGLWQHGQPFHRCAAWHEAGWREEPLGTGGCAAHDSMSCGGALLALRMAAEGEARAARHGTAAGLHCSLPMLQPGPLTQHSATAAAQARRRGARSPAASRAA